MTADDRRALLRWRLALGPAAEDVDPGLALPALGSAPGAELGVDPLEVDEALEFVYGTGGARMHVPTWLARLREVFPEGAVALVQKDAIERKGLTRLLFEPETLPLLEKNVDLVATLLSARNLVPEAARAIAREIVGEVVEELRRKLESRARTALLGAARRNQSSPLKVARNLDWQKTIRRNLKGWDRERRRLIPERFHFWANQVKRHDWEVILLVDQSGSMAVSAVYSAIMASIFASLDVLRTHLAFFNERDIVDMTPVLDDPVEVLFTAQLGGAEDLNRAVAFAEEHYLERPDRTLLLLVTDLFDTCGDTVQLERRMARLVESKVKVMVLLKLHDSGKPAYNHELAQRLAAVGVYCFGCTPDRLVAIVERIMKGQDPSSLATEGA
jgi:Mg-chelatase subunit ChlD